MKLLAVMTTVPTEALAREMARVCVARRLAACVQLSRIESIYRWEGDVQQEAEFRLMFKTTQACYDRLEAALRELHPYALPAIYALDVAKAEPAYAHWVDQSTAPQTD